jgi:hypothetical protein
MVGGQAFPVAGRLQVMEVRLQAHSCGVLFDVFGRSIKRGFVGPLGRGDHNHREGGQS